MSKFVKQFRRSFKVGDVIGIGMLRWRVDYIGVEVVVMTDLSSPSYGECMFWDRQYRWRKVKQ